MARADTCNIRTDSAGHELPCRYKGVHKHKKTGKFEAHLWVGTTTLFTMLLQSGTGRQRSQVYLGGYDTQEDAARFHVSEYEQDIAAHANLDTEELMALLKRNSAGFSRDQSQFRGVTKHHSGRWEARIVCTDDVNPYRSLGIFTIQEDAARAYDRAVRELKGKKAVTNFRHLSDQPHAAGNGLAGFSADSSMSDGTNCHSDNANWALAGQLSSEASPRQQQAHQKAHHCSAAASAETSMTSAISILPSPGFAQQQPCRAISDQQQCSQPCLPSATSNATCTIYAQQCGWAHQKPACSPAEDNHGTDRIVTQAALLMNLDVPDPLEYTDDELFNI